MWWLIAGAVAGGLWWLGSQSSETEGEALRRREREKREFMKRKREAVPFLQPVKTQSVCAKEKEVEAAPKGGFGKRGRGCPTEMLEMERDPNWWREQD